MVREKEAFERAYDKIGKAYAKLQDRREELQNNILTMSNLQHMAFLILFLIFGKSGSALCAPLHLQDSLRVPRQAAGGRVSGARSIQKF